ncbi:transcription initiation factor IIE, alpha subunit [Candidatus Scalindua japonica]|uniref:Transcription initiation factor IIE, alpha subunit n=1 Tax=Candidatus Scalindua japonica TaxID=1284222 RepID=A0A286U4A1_9BACT|nr:antitoxin [Candidatus Scalindua japonica]GAX62957.1 transcription initiation factor IIE, alpha subunit [Candidatus Scalindua japonica]
MKKLTIALPDNILDGLEGEKDMVLEEALLEGIRFLKRKRALNKYCDGKISFGRASELAGIPEDELAMQAFSLGIEPSISENTLKEELGIE